MKTLVIAGGTGFLGQALARHFVRKNWTVKILTRHPDKPILAGELIKWDANSDGPWVGELENATALINLCGESVNCRYHARNREAILNSRTEPTRVLASALRSVVNPPKIWLNAASATIYRHSVDKPMDEDTGEHGTGFSVTVCEEWERAFFEPELPRVRRCALRTSMVLGQAKNSVYPILARLAKCGLGGKLSSGKQLVSWIHEKDFVRAVEFVIENEDIAGPVNITAPAPVRNSVFMGLIRKSLGISFGIPHFKPLLEIAAWLLRTETELTLKSRYVVPNILLRNRFVFHYPFLDEALYHLAHSTQSNLHSHLLAESKSLESGILP